MGCVWGLLVHALPFSAGSALERREAMLAFLAFGGIGSILFWGFQVPKEVQLPIAKGPQSPPTPGPRGKI